MKKQILLKTLIIVISIALFAHVAQAQTNWTVKSTSNSGLVNNHVSKLYQAQKGDIWIGTKKGLSVLRGDNWDTYSKSNGMPHKWITDISEDNDGNIWVATFKGIVLFEGNDMSYINTENGLVNNKVFSIEIDSKGNVWVGTRKGVSVYDGQNWKTYTRENGLGHNWVNDIMEDMNGNMWFAHSKGVSVFDGENWRSYTKNDGLARNLTMSMDKNSSGKIWFGNYNGAFSSYDGSNWENIKKGSGYYDFRMPAASFFAGAAFSLGTGIPVVGGALLVLGAVVGALPHEATIVYIDSNDLIWLAAQPKGVFMFDGQNWMQYTKKNGLPHKRVNAFMETSDGDMWFGTLKGIAIMKK